MFSCLELFMNCAEMQILWSVVHELWTKAPNNNPQKHQPDSDPDSKANPNTCKTNGLCRGMQFDGARDSVREDVG